MEKRATMPVRYQDALRAIGALLDARSLTDVRIVEGARGFEVHARWADGANFGEFELLHLDEEGIRRLISASIADRGRTTE